jgi:hypothetical protein
MRNKGFLKIYYEKGEELCFNNNFTFFHNHNILLTNPLSNDIRIINFSINEEDGIIISKFEDIQNTFDKHNDVCFQFWLDDYTDFFAHYYILNSNIVEYYSMDGFDNIQMDFINPFVWSYLLYLKKNKKIKGFVYDMKGYTEDIFDWDAIILLGEELPKNIFPNCIVGYFDAL